MKDLKESRRMIDEIDEQLIKLFEKRMETISDVAAYKLENGMSVLDSKREEDVLNRNIARVSEKWQPYYREFQESLFSVSRKYQKQLLDQNEPLLKDSSDYSTYIDNAFLASQRAKKDLLTYPETVDATVGTLYGRDNAITAFKSVYEEYNRVSDKRKASYAGGIQGNEAFNKEVYHWINRLDNLNLPYRVVATPGGTGAITLAVTNCLNPNEKILIPEIAWGSYRIMALQHNEKVKTYKMFVDHEISIEGIKEASEKIMHEQHKLLVIINDPCQNPTGISLGKENWRELIAFYNELSKEGPIVILNDIAYLDYSYDYDNATAYMSSFNAISDNIAVIVAFSCSKSLTAYGMRLGAAVIMSKEEEKAERIYNAFLRTARADWSNVNNGFMDAFVSLMQNNKEGYMAEKKTAVEDLQERAELFLSQAKACDLPVYPYVEGFFVTLKIEDPDQLSRFVDKCMENHIYGVRFNKGYRIAICSLSKEKLDGLAPRLKSILEQC